MGNNAVKTIVLVMVLVVLSFLIGAQISGDFKDSLGAFAVIGTVLVGFFLLLLGKNSWYLAFLLPPVLVNLPLPYIDSTLAAFLVSAGLFAYYVIQCNVMGYDRMRWHSFLVLDGLMLLIFVYMFASYYMYPVSINILGLDMEYVGGSPYVYAMGACIYFIFFSFLNVKRGDVEKVVRWAFYLRLCMMLVMIAMRLKSGDIYWSGEGDETMEFSSSAGERRITVFSSLGFCLLIFAYASRSVFSLLRSPVYLGMSGLAFFGISLTGARNQLVQSALCCIGVSVLRREITALAVMGMVAWVGLIGLGSGGAFENIPRTAQRFIAIVPGVKVSRATEYETESSSNVRLIAWKQAFDPRNGYIRDYIWGDGFQLSARALSRGQTAALRGTAERISDNDTVLARTGNWHNGFIYTMHRLGLVGCFLFYSVLLIGMAMFIRVGAFYVRQPFFPYFCVFSMECFVFPFVYSYNSRTPVHFFSYVINLSFIKLMYCLMREQGEIPSLFQVRQRYVPLLIQEDMSQNKHF